MGLSLYNKKRDFSQTSEPSGKKKSSKGHLRFVIQKHDASHLHYDFRLEMDGVLKSWAVPKGPSLNPSDKRLAMHVEDHPYDYRNFEGIIPEGNYGGGTVIVWDEGTYELDSTETLSRKEEEKLLLEQLEKGSLKIIMHGQKIKGQYNLFLLHTDKSGKSWMLIKKKDEFASDEDVTEYDRSVKSGKTIAEVARANGVEVKNVEKKGGRSLPAEIVKPKATVTLTKKAGTKKTKSKKNNSGQVNIMDLLGKYSDLAHKRSIPKDVEPMLARLVEEPFDKDDWLYEIKWDGYRAVAYVQKDKVALISRNDKPFTERYYPVTKALQQLGINAVFDGEIVAVNEKGLAEFQLLQNWQTTEEGFLQYFVFDIIWLEGYDLTKLPLVERKRILKKVLGKNEVIRYSDHVVGKGKDFFKVALDQGLEGIMAKRANSTYVIGTRTDDWLKIKVNKRQEVVIAGFTEPRRTRKYFGSLILGVYDSGYLTYIGHSGSGFNLKSLKELYELLLPLKIDHSPFKDVPKTNMPVTWVKPKLVCEIKFTEWTAERIARHPIFMGLRTDKKAKDVTFEKAVTMAKLKKTATKKAATKKVASKKSATKKASARTKRSPKSATKTSGRQVSGSDGPDQEIILNKQTIKLTNLQKVYWPVEKFTKGDMVNYYLKMAPYILPYLLDRPMSLNRHPNGIDEQNFYQKDMKGKAPEWAQTHHDFSESTGVNVEYLVCSNQATLIYMANLGCIEMNPWHSRVQNWQYPDWCLIDLDPDKSNTFNQVMEVAKVVKQVLDSIGAKSYCKTSGSSGIHIFIPLGAKYNYDQSKQLAELVVTIVNNELPDLTSIERNPAKRPGKIYLDFLQNRETQTAAAAYSLRPKSGVPVSTPLDWSELKKGLTIKTYNAYNIYDRVKSEGDLFKPVLGKGIDLNKVLNKLAAQMK